MNKKLFSILFLLSGLGGLTYEILWIRLFSSALGNTYLAISIIVASFMFGLYLGSWLIGKYIDKLQNELKWYAFLELIVGGYALFLLLIFGLADAAFQGLYAAVGGVDLLYSTGKLSITLFFLIVPTTAMGATLPLIIQYYSKTTSEFGDNISLFYGLNTIGGAIGALFAGFYLIEHLGVRNSLMLTACINLLIGAIVLLLLKIQRPGFEGTETPKVGRGKTASNTSVARTTQKRIRILYLSAAGLAGLAALSYQIIWTRGLKFLIHNSTYTFSVILFVFLLGIAFGSALSKYVIKKSQHLDFVYGLLQILLGVYCLFTIYLLYSFSSTDFFQAKLINMIYDYAFRWYWAVVIYAVICAIVFLIPTIIMGLLFPLINELYFKDVLHQSGRTVSTVIAVNTIGAITGSLLAGFMLIPLFGIKISIILIALVNFAIGLAFIIKSNIRVLPSAALSLLTFVLFVNLSLNTGYLSSRNEKQIDHTVFYDEGLMSTVKVYEHGRDLFMSIDGNVIASTHLNLLKKEKLIAHLPFFVKNDIHDVLAVGLASGISAGSLTLHNEIRHIDCVELIKPVFEGAKYFSDYNFGLFRNPKVKLIQDDIFAYLKYHDKKYDLISSDGKLGSLYSGNTVVLSSDYYELSKQRLKEGGLFIQWIPIITPSQELQVILNTLKSSFRYVSLFYFYPSDIFMLASESPITLDKLHMEEVLKDPDIRREMQLFKIYNAEAILSSYIGSYPSSSLASARINSFDKPILEFEYMREWKKSRNWPGGYRARNAQLLTEIFEKDDDAGRVFTNIDNRQLNHIRQAAGLFFKGCVNYFITRNFNSSFKAYYSFQQSMDPSE